MAKFIKWSTMPFASDETYDEKLVKSMLVHCSTKKELLEGKPNLDVIGFIDREIITTKIGLT